MFDLVRAVSVSIFLFDIAKRPMIKKAHIFRY
jgi:hypothetical protein